MIMFQLLRHTDTRRVKYEQIKNQNDRDPISMFTFITRATNEDSSYIDDVRKERVIKFDDLVD